MKTIGMIGGTSWQSTVEYYRIINQNVNQKLGGWHSAKCLIASIDFAELQAFQRQERWDLAEKLICDAGRSLTAGGADFIIICANTIHRMAEAAQAATGLPLLHIADATGRAINERGFKKVGLLGTRVTMEQEFLKGKLRDQYGLEIITPEQPDRLAVNEIIYNELCFGTIKDSSRRTFIDIIDKLQGAGAEGVILGCTEIPLLIKPAHVRLPVFDTTEIHARAAVEKAVGE